MVMIILTPSSHMPRAGAIQLRNKASDSPGTWIRPIESPDFISALFLGKRVSQIGWNDLA